jgi:3'(2'), 5'-bisphosphate nucleotidase
MSMTPATGSSCSDSDAVLMSRAPVSGRPSLDTWAMLFGAIAVEAGGAIMAIYERGCAPDAKADGSPVTEADLSAERIVLQRLRELAPRIPVLAEEEAAAGRMPDMGAADTFILVDPLDGTREFIAHNGEFTVNIALVSHGIPVAGAVYAPVLDTLWVGGRSAVAMTIAPGQPIAAARQHRSLAVRSAPEALVAVASRSHGDPTTETILARLPVSERISAGSSLKFCTIAEGRADIYPRCGPTMEWDTAAGHAVLSAAGGTVVTLNGAPFLYGKAGAGWKNGGFIAYGDAGIARLIQS